MKCSAETFLALYLLKDDGISVRFGLNCFSVFAANGLCCMPRQSLFAVLVVGVFVLDEDRFSLQRDNGGIPD